MKRQTKWSADQAHSEIGFKVRHLMIAHVKGTFAVFDGSIYTTGKDFTTAQIDLWIDAASLTTGNANRDEHLKAVDFFDTDLHKQITFISTTIEKTGHEGIYDMWGELTIKEVTKTIELQVEFGGIINDPWGKERAGFEINGKINRGDWGLVWNKVVETAGLMVSDEIAISCEVELINMGQKELIMELEPQADENCIL